MDAKTLAKRSALLSEMAKNPIYTTKVVGEFLQENSVFNERVKQSLISFLNGDWGICCDEDLEANEYDLMHEGGVLGVYSLEGIETPTGDEKLYIDATPPYEQDGNHNHRDIVVMFPSEY